MLSFKQMQKAADRQTKDVTYIVISPSAGLPPFIFFRFLYVEVHIKF